MFIFTYPCNEYWCLFHTINANRSSLWKVGMVNILRGTVCLLLYRFVLYWWRDRPLWRSWEPATSTTLSRYRMAGSLSSSQNFYNPFDMGNDLYRWVWTAFETDVKRHELDMISQNYILSPHCAYSGPQNMRPGYSSQEPVWAIRDLGQSKGHFDRILVSWNVVEAPQLLLRSRRKL